MFSSTRRMNSTKAALLHLRKVKKTDAIRKPCPAHHAPKYFRRLEGDVLPYKKAVRLTLTQKVNGWRGLLMYTPDDQLVLYHCKEEEVYDSPALQEDGARQRDARALEGRRKIMPAFANRREFLNHETIEPWTVLFVELCAYMLGKREMGHNFVKRAINTFVQNGFRNLPGALIHLRLRIFGLHTLASGGQLYTPKKTVFDYLETLVRRGNPLIDMVAYEHHSIQMVQNRQSAYFDAKNQRICWQYTDYMAFLMERLKQSGDEGYVLYAEEEAFPATAVEHAFEGWRNPSALKIKDEPRLTCVAMKVEDHRDTGEMREEPLIYLYCRQGDYLQYAGSASDNPAIRKALSHKTAALTFKDADERKRLFRLRLEDMRNSGMQVEVSVVHITSRGFLTGIKHYGVKTFDHIVLTKVSVVSKIAAEHAHLSRLNMVRQEYEIRTQDREEDDLFNNPPPVKKPTLARPGAQVAEPLQVRQHSPERKHSPEPQYSPVRQHLPEPVPQPRPQPQPELPQKRPGGPIAEELRRYRDKHMLAAAPDPVPPPRPAPDPVPPPRPAPDPVPPPRPAPDPAPPPRPAPEPTRYTPIPNRRYNNIQYKNRPAAQPAHPAQAPPQPAHPAQAPPQSAPPAQAPPQSAPPAQAPRPRPTDEDFAKVAKSMWEDYVKKYNTKVVQEVYYYKDGVKTPVDTVIPFVMKPEGGVHDGPWPVRTTWPVKDDAGEYRWRDVYVGKPEHSFERKRWYTELPRIQKVYLDEYYAQQDLLHHKVHYFGGDVVTTMGPDVDLAIVGRFVLRDYEAGGRNNACARLKAQMPQVRLTTEEGLAVALRPPASSK